MKQARAILRFKFFAKGWYQVLLVTGVLRVPLGPGGLDRFPRESPRFLAGSKVHRCPFGVE